MVLQCVETRPRVHTFTSASPLNNNNIIGSYNSQHATKSHSKVTNSGEQTKRLWQGTKPPQSYSFQSIRWGIPISVTNSPRVRTRITP